MGGLTIVAPAFLPSDDPPPHPYPSPNQIRPHDAIQLLVRPKVDLLATVALWVMAPLLVRWTRRRFAHYCHCFDNLKPCGRIDWLCTYAHRFPICGLKRYLFL